MDPYQNVTYPYQNVTDPYQNVKDPYQNVTDPYQNVADQQQCSKDIWLLLTYLIGIVMEIRILIGIKTMPIHNTGRKPF